MGKPSETNVWNRGRIKMKVSYRQTRQIDFFLPMKDYPKSTHQHKLIARAGDKIITTDKPELKETKAVITAALSRSGKQPDTPYFGYIKLDLTFCFAIKKGKIDGDLYNVKPDRDNCEKTFVDIMAKLKFISNDSQIVSGNVKKIYSKQPGVYINLIEYKRCVVK